MLPTVCADLRVSSCACRLGSTPAGGHVRVVQRSESVLAAESLDGDAVASEPSSQPEQVFEWRNQHVLVRGCDRSSASRAAETDRY